MERLKAILADKILDLSTSNGDEVKAKVDKIQRFRDFANACKTLMIKYPAIEDELINMVESGDFDTKVASSRVDTIIRLADTEASQPTKVTPQIEDTEAPASEETSTIDDIPMDVYQGEEEVVYQPEDIDYEELDPSPEDESESGYISFQEVSSDEALPDTEEAEEYAEADLAPETIPADLLGEDNLEKDITADEEDSELAAAKRKVTIRRVVQAIGAVLAIVAVIFIVKFVMIHWQTILIIAGILIVLAILIVWYKRKRS